VVIGTIWAIDFDHTELHAMFLEVTVYGNNRSAFAIRTSSDVRVFSALSQKLFRPHGRRNQTYDIARKGLRYRFIK